MTGLEAFAIQLLRLPSQGDSDAIAAKLRLHILDSAGAMVAGYASAEGRAIAAQGSTPHLFGESLLDRIAVRIAQTRLTEIDDIHMPSCTTVGSVIVPLALELGGALGSDRARLEAAIRAGYDAMVRLGAAVDGARILYKGIWPTYLTAPFGAAACAGVLIGLNEAQLADALALALAQTSGAAGGPAKGRNPRWLLAGWAAAAGVRAALAARDGYGGDRSLLDGSWLQTTHGIAFDAAKLEAAPGSALLEMSMKPWCTAKQASSALAGFIQLLDDGLATESIEKISVHVPAAYRGMISHQPPGRLGRIVSIAWQCGVAAFHRGALLDIERADFSSDSGFAALMEKVEAHADPALEAHFPGVYPARVKVTGRDGGMWERTILHAPGDPERALDEPAVIAKFCTVAVAARAGWQPEDMEALARDILADPAKALAVLKL